MASSVGYLVIKFKAILIRNKNALLGSLAKAAVSEANLVPEKDQAVCDEFWFVECAGCLLGSPAIS